MNSSAGRKQQVIVFVKVVDATEIEACAIDASNGVGGLMEYFTPERQFFGDLSLEQPPHKPIILVAVIIVLIDPIATAAIRSPIAKALLHPEW